MHSLTLARSLMVVQLFAVAWISPMVAIETPDEPGKKWYKGNLHTHSLWSDGNDFPEMITKWYADRDYHFLALTDHNILSRGEKWMNLKEIESRAGKDAMKKYQSAFGNGWIESRSEDGNTEIRLKPLDEYRDKFEKQGRFLLMTGEEISDSVSGLPVHLNATNLKHLIRPAGGKTVREAINNNLRSAIEQSRLEQRRILVHLNHPNFGWAITAEDLAYVTLEKFFEVYNGHPGVNQNGDDDHPSVERLWDIANTIRIDRLSSPPLMGLATDDSHNYHGRPGSQPGRGWIMVQSKELSSDAILQSIEEGRFYASSGVSCNEIAFDSESRQLRVQIAAKPGESYVTQFIGTPVDHDRESKPRIPGNDNSKTRSTRIYSTDVGQTFATVRGSEATYELTGNELYVRAMITSSANHPNPSFKNQKQQAWTQPVGWQRHVDTR